MKRAWILAGIVLLGLVPASAAYEITGPSELYSNAFGRPAHTRDPMPAVAPSGSTTSGPNTSDWPHEGSYAKYQIHSLAPGRLGRETFTNATWIYISGGWSLACTGTYSAEDSRYGTSRWYSGSFTRGGRTAADGPPLVRERSGGFFDSGPSAQAWTLQDCRLRTFNAGSSGFFGAGADATWDPDTRLMLQWQSTRGARHEMGKLVSTDAPVTLPQ